MLVKVKKSHGQAIKNNNSRIFNYIVMHGGKVNSKKRVYVIKGWENLKFFNFRVKSLSVLVRKWLKFVNVLVINPVKMPNPRTIYYSSFACCLSIFKRLAISIFPFFSSDFVICICQKEIATETYTRNRKLPNSSYRLTLVRLRSQFASIKSC